MYSLVTVEDVVRVPPRKFGEDMNKVILSELGDTLIGKINKKIGIILAVTKVKSVGEGRIIMGDGASYHDATFEMLVYKPMMQEVVDGSVTEITSFGAFINIGPMDGLIHVSQVTEDFMSYNAKSAQLVGKESNKVLDKNDKVRGRLIALSMKNRISDSKIGLTMRQPYLGKYEWLLAEKKADEKKKKDDKKEKIKTSAKTAIKEGLKKSRAKIKK
ncbi:MAG: DNA-directed RNA polymerase [Candidatus Altiarchaeales archaeon HGW-Altiarchaeales-3]|nr:MAG: DNA-directed RNA polymerase [Candidatus Altiarchaeales archaeon HGW-Altiarchaeales-3]